MKTPQEYTYTFYFNSFLTQYKEKDHFVTF